MQVTTGAVTKRSARALGESRRQCPICDSADLEYEFVVQKSPVCGCQECGLLFINPQPSTIGAQASAEDPPDRVEPNVLTEVYGANALERLRQLKAYSGNESGRLLLVGADSHLSAEARKSGYEVVEFTAEHFEECDAMDLAGNVAGALLFCALERMRDPLRALQRLRALLRPNGALMVISPSTDSGAARLLKSSWWEFSSGNLFYFSVDNLQSLLIKAGFGDPMIAPERSLVSINYLRQRLADDPQSLRAFRWLRAPLSITPVFRNKSFRIAHGRTRTLVRAKTYPETPMLSVIVPVFNESATVVEMLEQLLAKEIDGVEIEVIIVESNSTDGSRELVQKYLDHPRVKLIFEEKPRGKGHAVREGLKHAKGTVVLFQDADLEYDINDYDGLIAPILRFQSNFILGSRHTENSWKIRKFSDAPGIATIFNFGHILFLTLFNLLYSQRLSDPFTMFKVFRRECLYGLSFECNRFDFDYEIVIKLLRKGYRARELPVNYRSRSLTDGKKVTMFRDPLTWVRALFRFRNSPLYDEAQYAQYD